MNRDDVDEIRSQVTRASERLGRLLYGDVDLGAVPLSALAEGGHSYYALTSAVRHLDTVLSVMPGAAGASGQEMLDISAAPVVVESKPVVRTAAEVAASRARGGAKGGAARAATRAAERASAPVVGSGGRGKSSPLAGYVLDALGIAAKKGVPLSVAGLVDVIERRHPSEIRQWQHLGEAVRQSVLKLVKSGKVAEEKSGRARLYSLAGDEG